MLAVTSFFVAISGFILVALSWNTISNRITHKVIIGDGGNDQMLRASRAQANFCEYMPLGLIMMALLEARGIKHWALILMGLTLIGSRLLHAYSLLKSEVEKADLPPEDRIKFRKIGMIGTLGVLALESLLLIV